MRAPTLLAGLTVAAAAAALSPSPAAAAEEAWRIGLLVANNEGQGTRPALRYAEQDATELADVLVQLGGFHRDDVHVLRGASRADAEATLAAIKKRLVAGHAAGRRVVLLFYFSGHSDGQALELGSDRWPFADVRRAMLDVGAEVRIAIIDSCRSGALLTEKGGRPGPTFDIRFTDDLATSGEAVLTSSAAHEMALESREIRASFFSHHFVSGLRGAADASGDGRVTLGEAYRYAFVNTLLATSNTLSGPQHPGYDFRLTGQGELVLTDLLNRGARLALPRAFDRILVADEGRRHLVAELTDLSARRIALPAGRYVVQARQGGRARQISVELKEGETRELAAGDLTPSSGPEAIAKGDVLVGVDELGDEGEAPGRFALGAGAGVTRGAADALPWMGALRVEAASAGRAGFILRLDVASGATPGFRESAAYLRLGAFTGVARGRVAAHAGWQVTGGPIVQALDDGRRFWTMAAGMGPWIDGSVGLGRDLALVVGLSADGMLLRRDGNLDVALWPAASVALRLEL